MSRPETDLAAAVEALARVVAPEVVESALDDARQEARDILRRRMVAAILSEAAGTCSAERPVELEVTASPPAPAAVSSPLLGEDYSLSPRNRALYVYGFIPTESAGRVSSSGIDGAPTYTVAEGALSAVVSDVCPTERSWALEAAGVHDLEPYLQQHERVLESVLAEGDVLPMRFGTCFPSAEAVRAVLRTHGESISAALDRLHDTVEWGLTVAWDPLDAERSSTEATNGRDYLSARSLERETDELAAQRSARLATQVHDDVSRAARAGCVHSRTAARGGSRRTLLRASYLVARTGRSRFESAIRDALAAGAALNLSADLTGPWPPYHFAELDLKGMTA